MKIKKIISIILANLIIFSYATTAYAATEYKNSSGSVAEDITSTDIVGVDENQNVQTKYNEFNVDNSAITRVYVSQSSTFSVTAPVIAVLSGQPDDNGNYTGDVEYSVVGNIASNEKIVVTPDDTFNLSQNGKDDINCSITLNDDNNSKTDFTYVNGLREDNSLKHTYTLSTKDITAGSWHGQYNTNIFLASNELYYSSIDKAVNDANNLTTQNADVLTKNSKSAEASVFVQDDVTYITLMNDVTNADNIVLTNNTVLDLNFHTLSFGLGKYLEFNKNLTVYDGVINIDDSHYGIFGAKDNTENSFVLNNVTLNQNISENISYNSFCIDISTANSNCSNLKIYQKGKGNSSYGVYGYTNRNKNEKAQGFLKHFIFESTVENPLKIRGTQNGGNDEISNAKIKINLQNNSAKSTGIYSANTSSSLKILDSDVDVYSTSGYVSGIESRSINTTIKNCSVNSDDFTKKSDVEGSTGVAIILQNKPTTSSKTIVEDCIIYGKQWGLETPAYSEVVIKNCDVTSTNHTAYICGNGDVYNSTFKITNRDKYLNGTLDTPYGFYAGGPYDKVKTHIVNIYNCEIGNPIDTSGKNIPENGVTAKNNGYYPPKEINIYDSVVYQGRQAVFNFNASSPYLKNFAKFNLYGNTKLMANSKTELSKNQVAFDIEWFKNPDITYNLKSDWESAKDDYIYFGIMSSPNKLINANMYCKENAPKSEAYEDYANVYDYR